MIKKINPIPLQNGSSLSVQYSNKLFRTKIEGRNFCASSELELRRIVSDIVPIAIPFYDAPVIEKPRVRRRDIKLSPMAKEMSLKSSKSFYDILAEDILQHEPDVTKRHLLLVELSELEKC